MMNEYFRLHDGVEQAAERELAPLADAFAPSYVAAEGMLRSYSQRFAENSEPIDVARVQQLLLPRLADELRVQYLIGTRGYVTQSLALAANAMEIAFMAAYIGFDVSHAHTWLHWTEPTRLPWRTKELIAGALCGGVDDVAAAEKGFYLWYQFFCGFKHANPVLQQRQPPALSLPEHLLNVTHELPRRSAWLLALAMYQSLWVSVLSVRTLFENDSANVDISWAHMETLGAQLRPLGKAMRNRTS